jgi:hypothetical protein
MAEERYRKMARDLLRLAQKGSTEAERSNAKRQADIIIKKYKLTKEDLIEPKPIESTPQVKVTETPENLKRKLMGTREDIERKLAQNQAMKDAVVGVYKDVRNLKLGKLAGKIVKFIRS